MSFMAQIRLSDVPGLPPADDVLLSFHYCQECTYGGNMPFGLADLQEPYQGYDLTLSNVLDTQEADGLGVVAEDMLRPHVVSFSERAETPSLEDMWDIPELSAALPKGRGNDDELECIFSDAYGFVESNYPGFIHIPTSKLGGWPSWCQSPEWPEFEGRRDVFVAQLDWVLGENASWGGGGYAYLFVTPDAVVPRTAHFLIQTT